MSQGMSAARCNSPPMGPSSNVDESCNFGDELQTEKQHKKHTTRVIFCTSHPLTHQESKQLEDSYLLHNLQTVIFSIPAVDHHWFVQMEGELQLTSKHTLLGLAVLLETGTSQTKGLHFFSARISMSLKPSCDTVLTLKGSVKGQFEATVLTFWSSRVQFHPLQESLGAAAFWSCHLGTC